MSATVMKNKMHTPIKQCTSDCRRVGCPAEDVCDYCGENKWENPKKHIEEMIKFLQEKMAIIAGVDFGESLEILNKL